MNDYFDQLELELREAVGKRRHLPWYVRVRLPKRGRGLLLVVVGLAVATPAAVGAVSGWFSAGQPVKSPPVSATRGDGKVLPGGSRLLAIRVADPEGGPPWGMRLVRTTRGDSCIQVGRVQGDQIGSLGIDNAFHNDHEFHAVSPNDTKADICGATDGAGVGFVNVYAHDTPASVNVPIWNGTETASPQSGMRMIFAGVLGPDARRITYKTPSGRTLTEATSGSDGAYLIVFRQTFANCFDFEQRLPSQACGSRSYYGPGVQSPTPITSIAYAGGKTCRVPAVASERVCKPVGWVAAKPKKLTDADVAAPVKVHVSEHGNRPYPAALIKVSFTAREPVTSSDSLYQLSIQLHGHGNVTGGEVVATNADIHRGQRVTLTVSQEIPSTGPGSSVWPGLYHGKVSFFTAAGPDDSANKGGLTVGRFSFKLPRHK